MPCLVVALALLFPRVTIAVLYFFTTFFDRVFDSLLLPLVGFLLLPFTLLAYTWMTKYLQPSQPVFLIVMIVAVVLDLGSLGSGARRRRRV